MKTKNLPAVADALYQKMQADGYSKSVIGTARWIIGHFRQYCTGISAWASFVTGGSCFAQLFGKFYREKQVIERIAILLENYS